MQNKYYSIDKVLKMGQEENSNFIFIYGGKSKGKSYQAKKVLMIENYLKTGKRFILLRRYDTELDKSKTELYFRDYLANENLLELTDGKYNNITYISNKIFFTFTDDKGKIIKKEHIGYAIPLNCEQNFSSILSEKDVSVIVFEEFQSRTTYLTNECDKLMFFYSTIDREQGTTKVYFMGNAISKACPYWSYFGILNVIKEQRSNTIRSYTIDGKKILIEKTPVFNARRTTVGQSAGAISRGDWYSEKQPHVKMKGHKRGLIYVNFDFSGLKFAGELNTDENGAPYWFIRSVEFFKKKNIYTVTNKFTPGLNTGASIYSIGGKKFQELAKRTFTKDKIFFSTDEAGTDFNTACIFRIKV